MVRDEATSDHAEDAFNGVFQAGSIMTGTGNFEPTSRTGKLFAMIFSFFILLVVAAYTACGCTLDAIDRRGDWTVLRLTAGADRYVPTAPFDPKGRDGWALDL